MAIHGIRNSVFTVNKDSNRGAQPLFHGKCLGLGIGAGAQRLLRSDHSSANARHRGVGTSTPGLPAQCIAFLAAIAWTYISLLSTCTTCILYSIIQYVLIYIYINININNIYIFNMIQLYALFLTQCSCFLACNLASCEAPGQTAGPRSETPIR